MDKDWVGIGKRWADVPPQVKCTVAVILTIPDTIYQQLLPSKNVSIHQLIDFTLPKGDAVLSTATLLDYFCHNPPDLLSESSLSKIKRLLMPSASVTKELVVAVKQGWLDGFESVKYVHISTGMATHFPLWLITFWGGVYEL
jgi:hypothetical protein